MINKSNSKPPQKQHLPAGISPNDHNIEFVGVKDTKRVIWFQNGNCTTWENLPIPIYKSCEDLFLSDTHAVSYLNNLYKKDATNTNRLVEIYIYFIYGDLDNTPDVINGQLQQSENFRDHRDCPSLNFKHKHIDIDGTPLNKRDLTILDDIIDGLPDKLIAHRLGIKPATFDFHKRNLFKKYKVDSKVALAVKTIKHNISCAN